MRMSLDPDTQMDVASCDPRCSYGTQQKFLLCDVSQALLSSGSEFVPE